MDLLEFQKQFASEQAYVVLLLRIVAPKGCFASIVVLQIPNREKL